MTSRRARGGFTLLELLAVVALLGLVLFFVIPNLDGLTPRARLRATARRIGSTMELAQGEAISSGKQFTMAYDLNKKMYWIILPPPDVPATLPDPNAPPPPLPDVEHAPMPAVMPPSATTGAKPTTPAATATKPGDYTGRDTLEPDALPDDVDIGSVSLPNGKESSSGVIYVNFSALGNEGSHGVMVRLRGSSNGTASPEPPIYVRFNALTRTVDFGTDKPSWTNGN
jgi:prepilin-type N-terminal cleavage/methylation domain-containing protein